MHMGLIKRSFLALSGLVLVLAGQPAGANSADCSPDKALLWLRLGMAIGQNSNPPTTDELATLLASIDNEAIQNPTAGDNKEQYLFSDGMNQDSGTELPVGAIVSSNDPLGDETFWIRLGWPEAPLIYMFIDPTCPYCSQGLQKLAPLIERRQLQVRIILVPILNEASAPLVAKLILSENPADAIWQHEIVNQGLFDWDSLVGNDDGLKELGPKGLGWLKKNYDWMQDRNLYSVPLYVWAEPMGETGEGKMWQIREGVQEPLVFQAALPPAIPSTEGFGIPEMVDAQIGNDPYRPYRPASGPLPLE